VATDIAARGIDVDELEYVINFEIPNISETYVHRIGRTGRAGAKGTAISFCDAEEKEYLRDIEKLISKKIHVINDHAYPLIDHNPVKPVKQDRRSNGPTAQRRNGAHNNSTAQKSNERRNGTTMKGRSERHDDSTAQGRNGRARR
jgi:ATP-dependent RNA helicase RhlE